MHEIYKQIVLDRIEALKLEIQQLKDKISLSESRTFDLMVSNTDIARRELIINELQSIVETAESVMMMTGNVE